MAKRPVFLPDYDGQRLVEERIITFEWAPGFSPTQKKRNIHSLHSEAKRAGIKTILEISSKSDDEVGKRLSAFSLKLEIDGTKYPLECVYQGSKVFENCGPFPDLFELQPVEAKRFIRDKDCGRLKYYELEGIKYPLSPKNALYDWLYIRCLKDHAQWISSNVSYDGFTDIEFNPAKQVNCQARAFAEYLSLLKRSKLQDAASNFEYFVSLLNSTESLLLQD